MKRFNNRPWLWSLSGVPLGLMFGFTGGGVERLALLLAALALIGALFLRQERSQLSALAFGLILAGVIGLGAHLLGDHFQYAYVWLYSAPQVPWYLKLANIWGGDEGTLLFLALLFAACSRSMIRHQGWAGTGEISLTLFFCIGALIWNPFAQTPAADLTDMTNRGMNSHLLTIWMALHPPAIFAAYAFFLVPIGAALEALAKGTGDWDTLASRYTRLGWLVLSIGLAFGMAWAYEDLTFGQFWHWDPVQTSVFVIWALATAQLHLIRRYRQMGPFSRIHPLLGVLCGVAALVSMAITRSPMLASSHRYVGDTSLPFLLLGAGGLLALCMWALWQSRNRQAKKSLFNEGTLMIWIGAGVMMAMAVIASGHLVQAFVSTALDLPRPAELKPFFETLARWSNESEIIQLRAAFAQWDVYTYSMNKWMAPMAIVVGLMGGHAFLPVIGKRKRWMITACVAVAIGLAVFIWHPFASFYKGIGMTSANTVSMFGFLDGLSVAVLYLLTSGLLRAWETTRRTGKRANSRRYDLPVALVHSGVTLALVSILAATVFDTFSKKTVVYPDDFGKSLAFPDGYDVTLAMESEGILNDGAKGQFSAVASAGWTLKNEGKVVQQSQGNIVYRDERPPVVNERSPVRLLCEMLDYRYARYLVDKSSIMQPFIHRGLFRDVQVWFPSVEYSAGETGTAENRQKTEVPVVLKVFPFVTGIWLGLTLAVCAAMWVTALALFRKNHHNL